MNEIKEYTEKLFEDIKHIDEDGTEYWQARELMPLLEYSKWENFNNVIQKAVIAYKNSDNDNSYWLPKVRKPIITGKGKQDIEYVIKYCSDNRIIAREYYLARNEKCVIIQNKVGIMNLLNNYFHSVHSYLPNVSFDSAERALELEDILEKYRKILGLGCILPYADIKKLYGDSVNRNRWKRLNGDNYVSVSLHEKKPEEMDLKMYSEYDGHVENAFEDFVIQEPSIVLSDRIKEELMILDYPGIYLERFVKGPIPLEYMEAISILVPDYLRPFFCHTDPNDYEKLSHDTFYRIWPIEYIDELLELLSSSNYHVPLVDVLSGEEFKDNKDYRYVLKNNKSNF